MRFSYVNHGFSHILQHEFHRLLLYRYTVFYVHYLTVKFIFLFLIGSIVGNYNPEISFALLVVLHGFWFDQTLWSTYLKMEQSGIDGLSLQICILLVYCLICLQVTPNAGRINLSQGTPITWWAPTVCLYSSTTSEEGDSWSVTERRSVSGEHYEALSPHPHPFSLSPLLCFPSTMRSFFSPVLWKVARQDLMCLEDKESTAYWCWIPTKLLLIVFCFGAWRLAKYEMDGIRAYLNEIECMTSTTDRLKEPHLSKVFK